VRADCVCCGVARRPLQGGALCSVDNVEQYMPWRRAALPAWPRGRLGGPLVLHSPLLLMAAAAAADTAADTAAAAAVSLRRRRPPPPFCARSTQPTSRSSPRAPRAPAPTSCSRSRTRCVLLVACAGGGGGEGRGGAAGVVSPAPST
jgi:hypothetical protein